ncbi:MAG TPA: hypothetical protein VJR50_20080 [Mycobacterium sp.]|jgi:hypothetical protein|nr:hypothetical protein [Mycobacterium sp.]
MLLGAVPAEAEPVAPQQDTTCAGDLVGALTRSPDQKTVLQCRGTQGGGPRWQTFASPYPKGDRWLTYGPPTTLHGEGQPNREIDSGEWVGQPQDPDAQCEARQQTVVAAGVLSTVQTSTGKPGESLTLQMAPLLFSVELRGNCLWQRVL